MKNTTWIWSNNTPQTDEYSEFIDQFIYESGSAFLHISCDSNYAAYINGQLAACGQYADYPYDKIYDEIDVTSYCKKGKNRLAILVWYYGIDNSSVYYPGNAGLLYELICKDQTLCKSNVDTLSRMSKAYMNHRNKIITEQLGLGYGYDATLEDNWILGDAVNFSPSVILEQVLPLRIRPCDKLVLLPEVCGNICRRISDTDIIYDLGKEYVGFLSFRLHSTHVQDIIIAYGEHLADNCVRHKIGARDFSISYRAKEGDNLFMNPFRRLGCRYLEIVSEHPVTIEKMAIVPTIYKLNEQKRPVLNEKRNKIYDMCVETLRLCMHEHYEDCPWREQALYTMDSRNQMLCGYYAFREFRFPRANLQLISKDNREDNLLSRCYPITSERTIPSFSLHYIIACAEYLEYSEDTEFLREIYPKLTSIILAFTNRIKDGLVPIFREKTYWNFYEWREGLSDGNTSEQEYDCILNTLLSVALQKMAYIAGTLGIENTYTEQAKNLNSYIRAVFWDAHEGICYMHPEHISYNQLGNALAILCGIVTDDEAKTLCHRILNDQNIIPVSLSMACFLYDALLKVDRKHYAPIVLETIDRIYTPMIDFGSTTVWETEYGESDFGNAGSLCHGWSALPIYYYHILSE